jgi:hypothetical protein
MQFTLPVILSFLALAGSSYALPHNPNGARAVPQPTIISYHLAEVGLDGKTSLQGPNGVYIYHNSSHYTYHGQPEAKVDMQAVRAEHEKHALEGRQWTCSTACQGTYGNIFDIQPAENALASHFDSFPQFSNNVVVKWNNVYAFGCD